jgi:F-type H+-transporting ATPase subunit epsilon
MNLKILLPFRIFARQAEVSSIVADTLDGSLGLLPHRLDCVAALVPGILTYSSAMAGTLYVALDGGVLVKSGTEVLISARRAVGGEDLAMLHEAVRKDFLSLSTQEREARAAIAKMEGALLGRLRDFQHAR